MSESRRAEEIDARLQLAVDAGKAAGRRTLEYFGRGNYEVELKQDSSPVTVADREAETYLRERIAQTFPEDAIVGEEFDDRDGTSGYRWILDPIDGTKSFVHGVPLYGTMVGVEHEGRAVVGVVSIAALDETVYAATGQGAWHIRGDQEAVAARVSDCARLDEAVLLTTDVEAIEKYKSRAAYDALAAQCRFARSWGDCYGYVLVATGRAEIMLDPIMNVWDAAALQPILEEAGGTFTDWRGEATIHHGEGIATNGRLLDQVLAVTSAQA